MIYLLSPILLRARRIALAWQNTHPVTRGVTPSSNKSGALKGPCNLYFSSCAFLLSKPKSWLEGLPLPSGPVQSEKSGLSLNQVHWFFLFRCLSQIHFNPWNTSVSSYLHQELDWDFPAPFDCTIDWEFSSEGKVVGCHFKWPLRHQQNSINNQ